MDYRKTTQEHDSFYKSLDPIKFFYRIRNKESWSSRILWFGST